MFLQTLFDGYEVGKILQYCILLRYMISLKLAKSCTGRNSAMT